MRWLHRQRRAVRKVDRLTDRRDGADGVVAEGEFYAASAFANWARFRVAEATMKSVIAISAGTLALLCGNSMAQDAAEVRVEATRIVSKTSATRSPIGFPMKDLS